jgi:hypothetical protein
VALLPTLVPCDARKDSAHGVPASGALILSYFFGALLFASGIIRRVLSFAH